MIKLLKISSLAILVGSMLIGCSSKGKIASAVIPADQFAFVEFYQSSEGKTLKGKVPSGRRIDSPTYSYDPQTQNFQIHRMSGVVVDSVQVLLGTGRILKGAAGSGVSSVLIGVNKLPFNYADLEIIKVESKSIHLKYKDEKITLAVGQDWKVVQTTIDTIKIQEVAIVETVTTTRIQFYGFHSKSKLVKP